MNLDNLETILKKEPKYRIKQAKEAVFQQLIENWMGLTSFPLELRKKLNEECSLAIEAEQFFPKEEQTVKIRLTLKDRLKIESVLMRHRDGRNTVCVSSQVGCPVKCKFCATGKMGFKRNLGPLEIVEQVVFFARYLKKEGKRVTNVVFMGMGEPFLNYENIMAAIRLLNSKEMLNIGARHISISTVGIREGIEKLKEEKLQVNLAISLHAPSNELRSQLIPINKNYPIEAIFKAVDNYIKITKRKVMIEYLLIKGVNDSDLCAVELAQLIKNKPLYFLNLILYNPTGSFEPSSSARVKRFKSILEERKVPFSQRYRFGREIHAACGQLITTS